MFLWNFTPKPTHIKYIVASLVFYCFSFNTLCHANGKNILLNGDFGDGGKKNIAENWRDNSKWANLKVSYQLENTKNQRGLIQKITCFEFHSGTVEFVQHPVKVKKGDSYKISFWAKGNLKSQIKVQARQKGSPYKAYFNLPFVVNKEWKKYTFITQPTENDSAAYFMFGFQGKGTLYLDDIWFEELDNSISNHTKLQKYQSGNLISNASFELGLERWGVLIKNYAFPSHYFMLETPSSIISTTQKHHGLKSLNISLNPNEVAIITSPYQRLIVGETYIFSCWLKSSQKANIQIYTSAGGKDEIIESSLKTITTKSWKKYTYVFKAKHVPGDAYYPTIKLFGKGEFWLDSVQLALEDNEDTNPFNLHRKIEVGISADKTLISSFEEPNISIKTFAEKKLQATLNVYIQDYQGMVKKIKTLPLNFGKKNFIQTKIENFFPDLGYYKIVAEVEQNKKILDKSEKSFGIIPSPIPQQKHSPFGSHVFLNNKSLKKAKKLGASWIRLHSSNITKWFAIEREKGKFQYIDEPIIDAKSLGFNVLGMLDTTPRWSSTAPAKKKILGKEGFKPIYPKTFLIGKNMFST